MWLKALFLLVFVRGALGAEDFLSELYGVSGRNKMVVCLKPTAGRRGRECRGALLHDDWVGVRAGCLRRHPQEHMFVLRLTGDDTCDDITHGYSLPRSRSVKAHFYHPWADFVMVNVNRPYIQLDVHPNSTKWTVSRVFKKYGKWKWMKAYIQLYALQRDPHHHYRMIERSMMSTTSPVLLFFLTIFLPCVVLALVYVYVMYYMGSSNEIPYKNLQYSRKATQV